VFHESDKKVHDLYMFSVAWAMMSIPVGGGAFDVPSEDIPNCRFVIGSSGTPTPTLRYYCDKVTIFQNC
jgi:hypothetical protein